MWKIVKNIEEITGWYCKGSATQSFKAQFVVKHRRGTKSLSSKLYFLPLRATVKKKFTLDADLLQRCVKVVYYTVIVVF